MRQKRPQTTSASSGEVIDLVKLEALARKPSALRKAFTRTMRARFDALIIDPEKGLTGKEIWERLEEELRSARRNAITMPKFAEVEVAQPGPMTDGERANVLSGWTRKGRR